MLQQNGSLETASQKTLDAWQQFFSTPLAQRLSQNRPFTPEEAALTLFHDVSQTVPAYHDFLIRHHVRAQEIQTTADFDKLPVVTKDNYLNQYPLADLCRHGQLQACDMIAVSSGSTGEPTFWPRFITDELRIADRFEQVFHDSFKADKQTTLAVVCFALGTWVGGLYTASCCRHLAAKGYPITVVTPGNNKAEIFRVIRHLGPMFEQVVLLGYPPFLKDVIDTGLGEGLDWTPYRIKLVMAGEVFSEEWRSLVGDRIGSKNLALDFASLYGTADAGVLGNETPLSITIRRYLAEHPEHAHHLFGESRLPTLVQYDPYSRYFQQHPTEGTLMFTGDNGIPLIRYHISDNGGHIPYEMLLSKLKDWQFDPLPMLGDVPIHPLPFVYVLGRSHFTVSYFGANIYPENVTVGLEQPGIRDWVTGKFVIESCEDTDRNRYLSITVELAPGISGDAHKTDRIAQSILTQLMRLNSEFANYVPEAYRLPKVRLLPMGHPDYFPIGVKHRYTRKPNP